MQYAIGTKLNINQLKAKRQRKEKIITVVMFVVIGALLAISLTN